MKTSIRCGLVMKEDITQLGNPNEVNSSGCGLVMKEDITQHLIKTHCAEAVVVW